MATFKNKYALFLHKNTKKSIAIFQNLGYNTSADRQETKNKAMKYKKYSIKSTLAAINRLTGATAILIDRYTGEKKAYTVSNREEAWTLLDEKLTVENGKLVIEFPADKLVFDDTRLAALAD